MPRKSLSGPVAARLLLCAQIVPLLLFPPSSWSLDTQEWWLPVLLTALVVVSLVQLLARRTHAPWPWYILSFAQGFNIISRLMMLLPRSTVAQGGAQRFNGLYVVLTIAAMLMSAFALWYSDLPEVRGRLA